MLGQATVALRVLEKIRPSHIPSDEMKPSGTAAASAIAVKIKAVTVICRRPGECMLESNKRISSVWWAKGEGSDQAT
jgi:hypothetical protein